jgi:hypothetical protein
LVSAVGTVADSFEGARYQLQETRVVSETGQGLAVVSETAAFAAIGNLLFIFVQNIIAIITSLSVTTTSIWSSTVAFLENSFYLAFAPITTFFAFRKKKCLLSGTVLSGGKPIKKAIILAISGSRIHLALTDAKGRFSLNLPQGSYNLCIRHRYYQSLAQPLFLKGEYKKTLELKLEPNSLPGPKPSSVSPVIKAVASFVQNRKKAFLITLLIMSGYAWLLYPSVLIFVFILFLGFSLKKSALKV